MPRVSVIYLACGIWLLASVWECTCNTSHADSEGHHRHKRQAAPTLLNRTHCDPGAQWPATRVNTTQRLADLREAMTAIPVDAFIVYSDDAHASEYVSGRDKRRGFISGFSGSAGWAAVTMTKAALWTDGRYFLGAEDALDCNWIFMKYRDPGVPSMAAWLTHELTAGQVVGADPFLVKNSLWQGMANYFDMFNITLTAVVSNPVDTVWTDQPDLPSSTINALDMKYAGRTWQDKISDVHTAMEEKGVYGATVVADLDEVAWLFNLRASDIEYNPFFIAYAIVEYYGNSHVDNKVRLYIYDKDTRLTANATDPGTRDKLHVHLNTNEDGSCAGKTGMCVEVREYVPSQVKNDVSALASAATENKIWINSKTNYAIFSAIPQSQRYLANSFIAFAKAQKNSVEARNMQICNNRDAVVQIEFFARLEKEIAEGRSWTELGVSQELKRMRLAAVNGRGPSFASISSSGPNGAIVHYSPSPETDRQLRPNEMFLIDSGGQYLECTTDTTRTLHFGTPTDYEKESYTRVLMGTIDLAKTVWPKGIYGRRLDSITRQPLWAAGMNYNHGTGHGIGAYFSVHEGPGFITGYTGPSSAQEVLLPNMFFSDEPAYYHKGLFGVRVETVLMVEPMTPKYNFDGHQYLRWKPIALVPFEPKLTNYSLMNNHQIDWLNYYNELTQTTIEPLLTTDLAKNWLRERTRPYVTFAPTHAPSLTPAPAKPCPSGNTGNVSPFSSPLPTFFTSLALGLAAALTLL